MISYKIVIMKEFIFPSGEYFNSIIWILLYILNIFNIGAFDFAFKLLSVGFEAILKHVESLTTSIMKEEVPSKWS